MLNRYLFTTILILIAVNGSNILTAQQEDIRPLNPDEKQALGAINERVVKPTLIYLASDALEGRGTPSRGFDIACEYVASRFEGAGLKGLGKDGSFFQTTTVKTAQAPTGGSLVRGNGESIKTYGMLNGGNEAVHYSGKLVPIDPKDDFKDQSFEGAVVFDELKSRSLFRELGTLGRLANKISALGATGMIIKCDSQSQLVAYAKNAQKPQLENRQVRISLPVLLVDSKAELSGDFMVSLPKQINSETVVRNTVGYIEGSDPELKEEAIIFTAHLDHLGIGGGNEKDRINNGADDNASGCTAVISLADAYAALETKPKRSVIFMTFWGEERGLLGSKYYCGNPLWPLEKTVANINIEMIGRPEAGAFGKCWMTGWDQSDLGKLMAKHSNRCEVEIFNHPNFSEMLYRASDNWPFVQHGVIAHSFSAGSLHKDYHKVTDEWELLNTEHMTKVIQGLFSGSLPLANGEVTPKKTGNR